MNILKTVIVLLLVWIAIDFLARWIGWLLWRPLNLKPNQWREAGYMSILVILMLMFVGYLSAAAIDVLLFGG